MRKADDEDRWHQDQRERVELHALAATGGKGTGTFTSTGAPKGTLNITIKWAASKGSTKVNIAFANQATKGKCAAGSKRVKVTGKVTGGSGAALKTFKLNSRSDGLGVQPPHQGLLDRTRQRPEVLIEVP